MTKQIFSRRSLMAGASASLIMAPHVLQAQQKLKVNLVSTQGTAGLAIQEIAISQGFLADAGVEAEIITVSDASKVIASLLGNTSDLCLWSGLGGVPAAIEKGAPLKIVGGALLFPTHAVYSSKPDIKRVSDLIGKTIGVGALGTQLHQVMLALLRKKGIDITKVTFRNVGSSTDVFRAVVAGTVDAGPSEVDVFEQGNKYNTHALDDANLWTEVPEFTFQAAYTNDESIAKKRPQIVRALSAFARAYRFVQDPSSKAAWIKAYQKASGKTDEAEAITQWNFIQKYQPYSKDLILGPDRIQFMQQLNVDLEVQKTVLPYEKVADMSLAREAIALLGNK